MSSPKKPKTSAGAAPVRQPAIHRYTAAPQGDAHGHLVAEMGSAYHADPQTRIDIIRKGVPASSIADLSARMGINKEVLLAILGMSRATINRKEKNVTRLSKDESERVLGIEMLIGRVQAMVEQSGQPAGFDAARWVADWLANPVPALAGATPASYMDTFEGQKLLADLLAQSQSGVYA